MARVASNTWMVMRLGSGGLLKRTPWMLERIFFVPLRGRKGICFGSNFDPKDKFLRVPSSNRCFFSTQRPYLYVAFTKGSNMQC